MIFKNMQNFTVYVIIFTIKIFVSIFSFSFMLLTKLSNKSLLSRCHVSLIFSSVLQYLSICLISIAAIVSFFLYQLVNIFWLIWKVNVNNLKKCFIQYIFLFINLKIFWLMDKVLHNQFDICPWQIVLFTCDFKKRFVQNNFSAVCKNCIKLTFTRHYSISMF